MNTKLIPYKISYLIFSFFISIIIVFSIHNGFKMIDLITIPIFAFIFFLIIDLSASLVYNKNLENFITEQFISHHNTNSSPNDTIEHLENPLTPLTNELTSNPKEVQIKRTPLLKKFAAYEEEPLEEQHHNLKPIPRPPIPSQEEHHIIPPHHLIPSEEEHHFPKPHLPSEEEHYQPKPPHTEEEHHYPKPPHTEEEYPYPKPPHTEEEHYKPKPFPAEEEQYLPPKKPSPKKPTNGKTNGGAGGAGTKQQQATDKQAARPDLNRQRMDDGKGNLINRNLDTNNPININVSYNNNRPLSLNNFNDKVQRPADLGEYQFDNGLKKKNTVSFETDTRGTLLNPVNQVTTNAALSNMNQAYYPAYLENPLNKEEPGTHVASVFDTNREMQNFLKQQKEANQNAQPKILQRKDEKLHWTQYNYDYKQLSKILKEKNSPAPVLLNDAWSEWKPVD